MLFNILFCSNGMAAITFHFKVKVMCFRVLKPRNVLVNQLPFPYALKLHLLMLGSVCTYIFDKRLKTCLFSPANECDGCGMPPRLLKTLLKLTKC